MSKRMLKEKMLRCRVMEFHKELTRKGHYLAGKKVLELLREGRIILDLSDTDFLIECELKKIGCKIGCGSRGYTSYAYLK